MRRSTVSAVCQPYSYLTKKGGIVRMCFFSLGCNTQSLFFSCETSAAQHGLLLSVAEFPHCLCARRLAQVRQFYTAPTLIRALMQYGDHWVRKRSPLPVLCGRRVVLDRRLSLVHSATLCGSSSGRRAGQQTKREQ
jgi:hypothetical protein